MENRLAGLETSSTDDPFNAWWLRDVRTETLDRLRSLARTVQLNDRDVVYGLGARQEWLWGVIQGQVGVHLALNEMEPVLGHIHQRGAWFGESEPLLGLPGLVQMQARGETTVVRIAFVAYRELAYERPELWEALARLTSMNQVLAMTAGNDLVLREGRMRIAAVLLRLAGLRADFQQTSAARTIPMNQMEIAALANVSASKLSEVLKQFAGQGSIQLEYGRLVILDPEAMKRCIAP